MFSLPKKENTIFPYQDIRQDISFPPKQLWNIVEEKKKAKMTRMVRSHCEKNPLLLAMVEGHHITAMTTCREPQGPSHPRVAAVVPLSHSPHPSCGPATAHPMCNQITFGDSGRLCKLLKQHGWQGGRTRI